MDIFFNDGKGSIKQDKDDINKQALAEGNTDIIITACFEELPERIVIDATNETSLMEEFLLNAEGQLEIEKRYPNAGSAKVFIRAYHPTNTQCSGLLLKTDRDLRKIIDDNGITCNDRTKNAVMRSAIWNHYQHELQLSLTEIDITKGETKSIWDKLQKYLPVYSLFQSDRKNTDGDSEVQDPLQEAVKQILNDTRLQAELDYSNLRLISSSDAGKTIETVLPGQLPYPSLNEVNYLAFSEITEEYHNELYGYIEAEGQLNAYKAGKTTMLYNEVRGGNTRQKQVVLSEYIRHQIHHPENTSNVHFTEQQLEASIRMLRDFVQTIV